MIVCLCKGITSETVREVVATGARTVEAVGRRCGAGTDCGSCHAQLELMIREGIESRSGARHLPVVASRKRNRAA
jgi:bacterioferritin-associated ferredoxin